MKSWKCGPETKRLLHRAFVVDDAETFYYLNTNKQVMKYTAEPLLASLEEARRAIETYPDFNTVGFGRWACVLKETGKVIGFCGLKYLTDLDMVDVGYRFFPEYWGRGLATEACIASLEFGFSTLKLKRIFGLVLPENLASIRVLEKAGLQPDGSFVHDGVEALRYVKYP